MWGREGEREGGRSRSAERIVPSKCELLSPSLSGGLSLARARIYLTSRHQPSQRRPCRSRVRHREIPTPWRTRPGRRRNARRCWFESSKRSREAFARPDAAAPPRSATFESQFAGTGRSRARSSPLQGEKSANDLPRGRTRGANEQAAEQLPLDENRKNVFGVDLSFLFNSLSFVSSLSFLFPCSSPEQQQQQQRCASLSPELRRRPPRLSRLIHPACRGRK